MERLQVGMRAPHDPGEAAIQASRYVLALPFVRDRRVLDLGCGDGRGAWLMAEAGAAEVVGIDIAAEIIAKAEDSFRNPVLRFRCMAAEDLAAMLPAGHFDMVTMIGTLEHVEDPRRCLRALRAVARPGALIVIAWSNDPSSVAGAHQPGRFDAREFQAMTTDILGDSVQWLGSPALGFAALPPSPDGQAPLPDQDSLVCGLWNAPRPPRLGEPAHGMPMDADARPGPSPGQGPDLRRIEAEMERIFTTHDASRLEREVLAARLADAEGRCGALQAERDAALQAREAMAADLARLQSGLDAAQRGCEIAGVQAAVLRREAEIIAAELRLRDQELAGLRAQSARIAELEDSLAWHAARVRTLDDALAAHVARVETLEVEAARHPERESSLAWHVARVQSLDEALAWHVARIEAIEAEPVPRLLRRLSSRLLRRAPVLGRIADRLRGRRGRV